MVESILNGEQLLRIWVIGFVSVIIVAGIVTGFFKARKIQPNGFKWRVFRWELFGAAVTALFSGTVLSNMNGLLFTHGLMQTNDDSVAIWIVVT